MGHVDLYETLGVGPADRAVSVRRAYRDLARLSHATTHVVPRFVEEMEVAYEVLSDGPRRAHYDDRMMRGANPADVGEIGAGAVEHHLDLLRDFEGGPPSRDEVRNTFRRNFAPGAEPKSGHVRALQLLIRVPEPTSSGMAVVCIAVPVFHPCARCHGTGSVDCTRCGGCDGTGLAEVRSAVHVSATVDVSPSLPERVVSLESFGVRSPILCIRIAAAA